jgi:hypothetical protein
VRRLQRLLLLQVQPDGRRCMPGMPLTMEPRQSNHQGPFYSHFQQVQCPWQRRSRQRPQPVQRKRKRQDRRLPHTGGSQETPRWERDGQNTLTQRASRPMARTTAKLKQCTSRHGTWQRPHWVTPPKSFPTLFVPHQTRQRQVKREKATRTRNALRKRR